MDNQLAQQAHRDYVESQVLSALPAERIYLLYKIAINSVNTAIARLKDGDIFARGRAVNKAHEAVDELNFAIDHSVGASFTRTLADLYVYVQRQLVTGHTRKSEQAFREALSVLTTLADTWREVVVRTCGPDSRVLEPQPFTGESVADEAKTEPEPASREVSEPYAAYGDATQGTFSSRDWSG
jgi:flagellar biosynthetic protein FliS